MIDWYVVGGLCQIGGVIAVGWGAVRTWRQFAPGESLLEPVTTFIASAPSTLETRLHRLIDRLRRRPQKIIGSGSIALSSALALDARGRAGWAPLPDDIEVQDALGQLDSRTRDLAERLANVRDGSRDEVRAIRQELDKIQAVIDQHVVRLTEQSRRVATNGVRISLVGGLFVALGVAIQTFA